MVMPSADTNILERKPVGEAGPSASPERSGMWMTCAVMFSAAIAGSRKCVAPQPAAKARVTDATNTVRFMDVSPPMRLVASQRVLASRASGEGRRHFSRAARSDIFSPNTEKGRNKNENACSAAIVVAGRTGAVVGLGARAESHDRSGRGGLPLLSA